MHPVRFHSFVQFAEHGGKQVETSARALSQRIKRTVRGPVTPNAETVFKLKKKKPEDVLALALLSWYLDAESKALLQLELENLHLAQPEEDLTLQCLLHSAEDAIAWISTYSDREIFGTWLPRIKDVAQYTDLYRVSPSKARRVIRRRGYRDHGTIRLNSDWLPSEDYDLNLLMQELEAKGDRRDAAISSIREYGLLGFRSRKISS